MSRRWLRTWKRRGHAIILNLAPDAVSLNPGQQANSMLTLVRLASVAPAQAFPVPVLDEKGWQNSNCRDYEEDSKPCQCIPLNGRRDGDCCHGGNDRPDRCHGAPNTGVKPDVWSLHPNPCSRGCPQIVSLPAHDSKGDSSGRMGAYATVGHQLISNSGSACFNSATALSVSSVFARLSL